MLILPPILYKLSCCRPEIRSRGLQPAFCLGQAAVERGLKPRLHYPAEKSVLTRRYELATQAPRPANASTSIQGCAGTGGSVTFPINCLCQDSKISRDQTS